MKKFMLSIRSVAIEDADRILARTIFNTIYNLRAKRLICKRHKRKSE